VSLAPVIGNKYGSGATGTNFVNWLRFGYVNNAADGYSLLAPQ
jgi:hypothetical protein